MPAISVIIPVHDVEDHVEACLDSLRQQSMGDFEAIVVDDGSTDQSAEIIRRTIDGDPRFHVITQENRGLGAARNAGLELAGGDYIAFLDGDDRYAPGFLFQMRRALEDSGADWVACGVRNCAPDGSRIDHSAIHGLAGLHSSGRLRRWDLTDWNRVISHFPSAWNKLYRRELIEGLRFGEGIWFEDHGFFYRAAARTDHLLHLAMPLYLQTRGRSGQITAADDERVFDQFAVLEDMRSVLTAPGRKGGQEAFEKIASRLLFERSTALRHQDRRARFATQAGQFLADQGLSFRPDWDPQIARSWGLEMAGGLPLSVVIPWDGRQDKALSTTLKSLARPATPGHEVLVICDTPDIAETARSLCNDHPQAQVLVQAGRGSGPARNAGLDAARGRYVCFLDAGHQPDGVALQEWVDNLLRTGARLSISAYKEDELDAPIRSGFVSKDVLPGIELRAPVAGFTPNEALAVDPHISAMLFERAFLQEHHMRFGPGALSTWQIILKAALCAPQALYHAWPGSLAPSGSTSSASRPATGVKQIVRAMDALASAIGEQQTKNLPSGWHRRLFARAVRQEMTRPNRPGGRPGKALFTLAATLHALIRGLTKERTALDPLSGPRLEALMSIEALLRNAPSARSERSDIQPTDPDQTLLRVVNGARVRFDVDFLEQPYANISFFDGEGLGIPFHLSLRQDQGVLVCNNRTGLAWGKEIPKQHAFSDAPTTVEILLCPREAVVSIDGHRAFRFRVWHPFARFGRLAQITSFGVQGAIARDTLLTEEFTPHPAQSDQLCLTDRLELMATLPDVTEETALRLVVDGADFVLDPIRQQRNQFCEISAVLPGRVWQHVADTDGIDVRLIRGDGSNACPGLHLDREGMAHRIDTILTSGPLSTDALAAMQVIEHVRYGNLMDMLSPEACVNLQATVNFFGLRTYLSTNSRPSAPPGPQATPAVDPVITATTRFNRNLRENTGTDPLTVLLDIIEDQAPGIRREVFFWLSDFFCAPERDFEAFHALFRTDGHGVDPLPAKDDVSRNSVLLPFLLLDGRIEELKTLLWSLDTPEDHWISAPALAWVLRRAGQENTLGETDREAVIYAALKVIGNMANRYWSRTQCASLIGAVVALLGKRDQMTSYLAKDIETFALRVYAMTPRFWVALEEAVDGASYGPELDRAHAAFRTIEGADLAETSSREVEGALDTLEALGCHDAQRVRRELVKPQSTSVRITPPASQGMSTEWRQAEETIRNLAFPGTPPPDAATAHSAAQALPLFYPQVPQAPYLSLQLEISQAIEALLAEASKGADVAGRIAELAPALGRLAGPRSAFLGIGLILTLLRGLAGKPGQHMAVAALAQLCDTIAESLDTTQRTALTQAALPRLAMQALRDSDHCAPLYQAVATSLPELVSNLPVSIRPSEASPRHTGSVLYDAIVVVFSCRANLDTRIPALRASWLQLLETMEIPFLVVVGDGDGRVEGDVLHLDAPDDYEGLPQKTLAAIRWIHDHTDALHMVKVDDDCFLNPHVFFRGLSYRKFDYYGRVLTRHSGQMDRAWHNEKSTSPRGRLELDKSPEPSTYTDGGSGYALSRTAMAAVLDAIQTPEGQRLQQTSFMEDKLVGDLLALHDIAPSQQDYRVSLRRRSSAEGQPVARWVNSFFASRAAPVSLVHLDDHATQPHALELLASTELRPKKIWPSFQDAALGYQSNALELVSDESRVELARNADVAVVSCTRNEMFMLPHFLRHYRELGVECFLIADNCSDDGTLEYLMQQPDVVLFSVDTDYSLSQYGVAWQQAMLAAFRVGKWSVVADADELLVWEYPAKQSLQTLLSAPEFQVTDAARVFMLDMYPGGELAEATFEIDPFSEAGFVDRDPFLVNPVARGPFSDMPTWTSALRHRLIPGSRPDLFVAQKIALLRYMPWMRLSAGMHYVAGTRLSSRELLFAHFKYNADFHRKVTEEVSRAQHFNGAEEYRKYLQVLSEGRDVVFEDGLSVPWTEAPFVKTLLER